MDKTKIIEKIKCLLALGDKNRNNSESEANAAILKAQELMAKYGIEVETSEEENISYVHEVCKSKWNMGFRKPLSVVIARNFKCETYLTGNGGSVVFFGHEIDAKIAKETFEFAYNFAMKEGNRLYNKNYQMGRNTQGVFNSYVRGFISGLGQKLEEQSTALVVVTPPDVKDKFNEMSKNFKRSSGGIRDTEFNKEAYEQGVTDGKSILNRRRIEK